ncbi:MAG: divalent metal cation transporter [Candidatus Eremiobacteraeota bacterium]|nr:divalent metal cation transporter [Candidatus Eremiobacteraeota bacterium]MBC5828368.1 divalent metal cation transporter [Candidatus Eremiobacteraeota bacterium]
MLVMLGENDGPSMLSYATTGATYGIGFFVPFICVTFLMAFVVQEMTVRLGIATHRGHAELIFGRFGPFWGYFAMLDLFIGNILTLITEFIAIRAGAAYFGIPAGFAVAVGFGIVTAALLARRYFTWERAVLVLSAANLLFVPAAIFAHPDVSRLLAALATWRPLPGGVAAGFITLLLANIGATVTPWMIFFQQSAVVDKGLTCDDVGQGRLDTGLGAIFAGIAAIATLVACAPLFAHHVNAANFSGGADFASALRPYLGSAGAALFALGIIEAGLVAAMTISTSSAYAFGEVAHCGHSLNLDFRSGRSFYLAAIISTAFAALVVLIPHAPLLAITITVNVVATLLMAPALVFLLLLASDPEIMGSLVNRWKSNLSAGFIVVAIAIMGAAYGVITVFPAIVPK